MNLISLRSASLDIVFALELLRVFCETLLYVLGVLVLFQAWPGAAYQEALCHLLFRTLPCRCVGCYQLEVGCCISHSHSTRARNSGTLLDAGL